MEAAERIIIEEGVHALTIRRVAARAQSNTALIGYHFGGVEGLLAELARLNAEAILSDQRRLIAEALGPDGRPLSLDLAIEALLHPLWREAALCPGERALVVVDEIASRADPALRHEVWSWFAPTIGPIAQALHQCLPHLDSMTVLWRVRFLSAAALDLPPRFSRSALPPPDGPMAARGPRRATVSSSPSPAARCWRPDAPAPARSPA
ncbi:MAG: helix-turn-helix domain-containing protein [Caulobacteraceae bacterium]